MKNLVILLTFALSFNVYAQFNNTPYEGPRISWSLYQDPSMVFFETKSGSKPFTTDIRFEFMMECNKNGQGSTLLGFTTEYADLSEFNFFRYGLQLGYNFRNQKIIIGNFETPFFDYAIYGGLGAIMRNFPEDNQSYTSFELTNELAYLLNDWISLNAKGTLMQRGDLFAKYNNSSGSFRPWDWEFNFYIGVKLYLNRN